MHQGFVKQGTLMKIAAYILFAVALVGLGVAFNNVFLGAGANRPAGGERLVGYAIGAFLFPLSMAIVGLILLNKSKQSK